MQNSDNKKNDGTIPTPIVNQLIEHTVGGFILFYFNAQTGEPQQIMTFDSPAHCLGLQKYISDWQEAVHQVNIESSVNNLQQQIEEIQEQEDDEEE